MEEGIKTVFFEKFTGHNGAEEWQCDDDAAQTGTYISLAEHEYLGNSNIVL